MSNKPKKKPFISSRGQMFIGGAGVWAFLCAWSMSAFLEHIDTLKPTYKLAAQCGAAGAEFVVLVGVFFHCFNVHIGVRKWSLILCCILLPIVIVVHAGALRGLDEAETHQVETEKILEDTMTRVANNQAAEAARINAENSAGKRQRERLAMDAKSKAEQADIQKKAQETIAQTIVKRSETIKSKSWMPAWYLNGGMYSVMFIAAILCFGVVQLGQLNTEDIDEDYDGKPDAEQKPRHAAQVDVVGNAFPVDHGIQPGKTKRSLWDKLRGKR